MDTSQTWHDRSFEQALSDLESSPEGLTEEEALKRQETYGLNRLPETKKQSLLIRFLLQFNNLLIYVLLGSAVVTALLEHWMDTIVILAVVIANAIIGLIQEGKAEKAMDSIRHMLAPFVSVLRGGERKTVEGEKLVPGDIVLLEAGDKVPADLRLLQTKELQIQEAILTGESLPSEKNTDKVETETSLGDRSGMAYSGTLVTSGQGKGLVVTTGPSTEIGRISGMLSEVETLTTPLVTQMDIFAKWITFIILAAGALIMLYGYFIQKYELTELFMIVVGLSVSAIPEGLPAVLTITLAIGVQAMARRNAIVRRLPAIETLGSVSVICTDKTGTLTRNEMSVTSALTHDKLFIIEGTGYDPNGEIKHEGKAINARENPILKELSRAASLCNDAEIHEHDGNWIVEGDPMEGALVAFSGKGELDGREERNNWSRKDVISFDSKRRYMATLNLDHENHAIIYVKGAPERILEMCSEQSTGNDGTEPLNIEYWQEQSDKLASQGQRLLALAFKTVKPEHTVLEDSDVESNLILLGMVGLIDPPRPEAITAVVDCRSAGIRVKMITGDHKKTAGAIGQQIGLQNPDKVLTGAELDKIDDTQLKEEVLETDIFARTNPEHKLRLVIALQSHGMTVAMTGDGVNDAPALKRADAGIAMGKKGSEAAKEAAAIVLADDNFASIASAVREGRTVYDNIKKVINWTLPTNGGEASTIIVALLFGMSLPVTPIQILWVNLITATTLGIALAFEPTSENIMQRPPRPRNEPLLNGATAWQILLVSVLFFFGVFGIFLYALRRGYSLELARTLAVNTLVVMEIFYLLFIRNLYITSLKWKSFQGTKIVWLTVLIVIIGQLAFTYFPPLQKVFATENVSFIDVMLIIGIGIALFILVEIEKQIRLRFFNKN